jgi:hypothetical protein
MRRFIIITIIFAVVSCNQSKPGGNSPVTVPAWQVQLDECIARPFMEEDSLDVRLLDYSFKSRVKSVNGAINAVFDDDMAIADYDGKHLVLSKVGDRKRLATEEELNNNDSRFFFAPGDALVTLVWKCWGKKYRTVALVSDADGVLYDNIGSRIVHEVDVQPDADNQVPATVEVRKSIRERRYVDFFGQEAYYSIRCTSSFNPEGILVDRSVRSNSHSTIFMKCSANAYSVSGELYKSNSAAFIGEFKVWTDITISGAPLGRGFTIYGLLSEQGNASAEHHRLPE